MITRRPVGRRSKPNAEATVTSRPSPASIPGQQATSAAEFQDEPGTHPHRLKQRQDSRRAGLGVEAETAVVNKRQVAAVTDVLTERHAMSVPRIGR